MPVAMEPIVKLAGLKLGGKDRETSLLLRLKRKGKCQNARPFMRE